MPQKQQRLSKRRDKANTMNRPTGDSMAALQMASPTKTRALKWALMQELLTGKRRLV